MSYYYFYYDDYLLHLHNFFGEEGTISDHNDMLALKQLLNERIV
jgi:hypothetical protein